MFSPCAVARGCRNYFLTIGCVLILIKVRHMAHQAWEESCKNATKCCKTCGLDFLKNLRFQRLISITERHMAPLCLGITWRHFSQDFNPTLISWRTRVNILKDRSLISITMTPFLEAQKHIYLLKRLGSDIE